MLYEFDGHQPVLEDDSVFVAPGASVIGRVELGKNSSIWFGAIIRADNDRIVIGDSSNIQDGAALHTDPGIPLLIGPHVTVGHQAMLHGCQVEEGSLVGIQAVILNRAHIGRYCLIGAKALVPEGMEIPDGSLVVGSPARIKRQLSDQEIQMLRAGALHYVAKSRQYRDQLKAVR